MPIKTTTSFIKKKVPCHISYKNLINLSLHLHQQKCALCKRYGNMISTNETCLTSSKTSPGKHEVLWELMHGCLQLYSQINHFMLLILLNFLIRNSNKFINFFINLLAFFLNQILFFGH